jgi:23S rRNA G2445 N2-methylase RlmL
MRPSGQSPRTFAYQFLPVGWCLTQLTPEKISYPPPSDGQFFIGQDKDERALTVFQKNLALCPFQTGISLIRGDSLTCLPRSIHQPILILTNPPYGRRLLNKKKAFLLIEKYLNTVLSIYHDVTIGIFFPENSILQKQASITKPFPHGGLDLFFYIIENSTL